MSGDLLVLLGQLLSLSVAAGLNLYATIAVLGLASRFGGGILVLPAELRGLEDGLLIATAGVLYAAEFAVDKIPFANSIWDALHTVIRPAAATLIALGLLAAVPLEQRVAAALLVGALALTIHGSKAGFRLTLNSDHRPRLATAISILEDVFAVGLIATALVYPQAAIGLVAASLLVAALFGPRLWRAFVLFLRALDGRIRGFFGAGRWREASELPSGLRHLVPEPALGGPPARGTRAAVRGLPGVGAYRNGWLVQTSDGYRFLYRSVWGPQLRALPPLRVRRFRPGSWVDIIELEQPTGGNGCTLFLLKDGPPPELALAELAPALT